MEERRPTLSSMFKPPRRRDREEMIFSGAITDGLGMAGTRHTVGARGVQKRSSSKIMKKNYSGSHPSNEARFGVAL